MSQVMETIEVDVPVRVAYNQWTQFEEFPNFMGGVEEIRQLDDTHLHWVASIAGVRREWDALITEQVPDRCVAWTNVDGATNSGMVTFDELDRDSTRVTLALNFEPEGLVENVGDKMGMVKGQARADLERFRDFIATRGISTGAWRGEVHEGMAEPGGASSGTPYIREGMSDLDRGGLAGDTGFTSRPMYREDDVPPEMLP